MLSSWNMHTNWAKIEARKYSCQHFDWRNYQSRTVPEVCQLQKCLHTKRIRFKAKFVSFDWFEISFVAWLRYLQHVCRLLQSICKWGRVVADWCQVPGCWPPVWQKNPSIIENTGGTDSSEEFQKLCHYCQGCFFVQIWYLLLKFMTWWGLLVVVSKYLTEISDHQKIKKKSHCCVLLWTTRFERWGMSGGSYHIFRHGCSSSQPSAEYLAEQILQSCMKLQLLSQLAPYASLFWAITWFPCQESFSQPEWE